mmetsp:Transcript_19522/g.23275  ORF Transcript_19522/g.23275 Transcript_19522/m.23275 type:complete len:213 (+) Transcript_19522:124-762(+)
MWILLFSLLLSGFYEQSTAFQSPRLLFRRPAPQTTVPTRAGGTSSRRRRQTIAPNMSTEDSEESDGYEMFALSPRQITALRKEAKKRKLPTVTLPPDETQGPFGPDTLAAIAAILRQHEVMQVRGISRDNIKDVREIAEQLAFNLEGETDRMVALIAKKGFAATLYCPMEDDDPRRIKLFTSFRPNQWKPRPRALRDSGLIMKDRDGNIIRM